MTQIVFGIHAVEACLRQAPERARVLHHDPRRRDRRLQALLEQARRHGVVVRPADAATLQRLSEGGRHQGVVLEWAGNPPRSEADLPDLIAAAECPLVLVLDGVTDPHNLGACLRTADAAGATCVIAPRDKSAGLTPVARKVASGAAEWLPFVQVTNLARTLDRLKELGLWVIGTAGEGSDELYGCDLSGPLALVMGAEGKGLRRLTREHCDQLVRIPMAGRVESLNVSVATGVCLFEALRQRRAVRTG